MPNSQTPLTAPYVTKVWTTKVSTGVTTYSGSNYNVGVLGSLETRTTNSNPNWRQEVSDELDASRGYLLRKCEKLHTPVAECDTSWNVRSVGGLKQHCLTMFTGLNAVQVFGLEDGACSDRALSSLKKKLRSEANMINSLVPLVELRELQGLARSMAGLTTGLLKTLINIKRSKGKSAARYASDAWLSYGFGIAPTLKDAYEIGKIINERFTSQPHLRLVGGCDSTVKLKTLSSAASMGDYAKFVVTPDLIADFGYRFIAGLSSSVTWRANYNLSDQLGFKFDALPATLWELVPYSWVTDYFLNIGTVLDDEISLPSGMCIYFVKNKKVKVAGSLRGSVESTGINLSKIEWSAVRPGYCSTVEFVRAPLSVLPHTGFHFKTMDQVGKSGFNKVANLAAILVK